MFLVFIIQIIGEFIIQLIGQFFGEALFLFVYRSLSEPFKKNPNPWLGALGFILIGSIVGGFSLLVLPSNLIPVGTSRMANLILTPLLVGLCTSLIGAWRTKRGSWMLPIDKFWHGYVFALTIALIRFIFAR